MTALFTYVQWEVAVHNDEAAGTYLITNWLECSELAPASKSRLGSARAVVEVRRKAGGVLPRALVGGEIRLTGSETRLLKVGQSAQMTLGAAKTCPSLLGRALVPGLPPEFAQATLDGLMRVPTTWDSGGLLVVDRGGYDEVESSPVAFELAGGLLILALLAQLRGTEIDLSALTENRT